jgi:hypothetical protein
VLAYLGLRAGTVMTVREFLGRVDRVVPGIEEICTHPKEDRQSRLAELTRGLEKTGIPELRRTTRDEPDYDKLMRGRLKILDQHGLALVDFTSRKTRWRRWSVFARQTRCFRLWSLQTKRSSGTCRRLLRRGVRLDRQAG